MKFPVSIFRSVAVALIAAVSVASASKTWRPGELELVD
jgi:hypothetical protein